MVENKNKIAVGTQAKHKLSSAQVSVNPQINKLINNIAKNTSYAYSSAVARAKQQPLDELHRRVFKKLRPRLSADRFKELSTAVGSMSPLDRYDWLREEERRLNEQR